MILRTGGRCVPCPRRSTDARARRPRLRRGLAITRPGEHQRVSGAIGCDRPRSVVIPRDFEDDGAAGLEQPQRAAFIGKILREPTEHPARSIHRLDVDGHFGDDEISLSCDLDSWGKGKIDVAADAPPLKIFGPRIRVVDFEEFEVPPVGARRGMIMNLRNRQPRAPRTRPCPFPRQLLVRRNRTGTGRRQQHAGTSKKPLSNNGGGELQMPWIT